MRHWTWPLAGVLLATLATMAAGADWYTRVEQLGVRDAASQDVALYERGQITLDTALMFATDPEELKNMTLQKRPSAAYSGR